MFSVTISEKGGQQSQYDFAKPEITIGRMKGNDIVLPKGNVSKQHTRIFLRDDSFYIVDLKSTNGTYVNGRKVTSEQAIGESDKIYIGDFILQLKRQQAQQQGAGGPGGQSQQPPQPPNRGSSPGGAAGGRGSQGGSGGGGGRHFPTVMDGADEAGGRAGGLSSPAQQQASSPAQSSGPASRGSSPGAPNTPAGASAGDAGQPGQPQRSASGAGESAAPGPGGPSPGNTPGGSDAQRKATPVPNEDDDLRKTYGESAPDLDMVPEIEPIEEEVDDPGSSGAGSGSPPPSVGAGSGPSPSPDPSGAAGAPVDDPPTPPPGSPSPQTNQPAPSNSPAPPSAGASTQLRETGPSPQAADGKGSALVTRGPLETEFDEEFHRAQQDVVRVFFESMSVEELPTDHPVDNKMLERRIGKAVSEAVDTVGPDVDDEELTDVVTREALGLGAVDTYLDDDSIRSIYVNDYDRVVLQRNGSLVVAERAFSHPDMVELAARRLLDTDDETEVTSGEQRFDDGTRAHVILPPVAVEGPALTIQKPNEFFPSLQELAQTGTMSSGMAEFLERAVESGRSIVIAGPTSSGKSTLLAALAEVVPESSRVVTIEQHSNLPTDKPNLIRLEASPASGFDMRMALRNAVAMHPDRILVDECRGAEGYDWVTAATTGTEGSMLTLHGTSPMDALSRLEGMCLLAAQEISPRGLREQVARSVDLVVVVNTTPDSGFRIQQIAEVQGVDIDAFRLNDIFYYRVEGTAGDFHPTGYIPLFYEDLRHAGFDVDLGIFRE